MTNDKLESGLLRLADAVEHLADSTFRSIDRLTANIERLMDVVIEVREETQSLKAAVDRLDRLMDYVIQRDNPSKNS